MKNNQNNQNRKNQKNQDCGNKNGNKNGEKDCNNHSYSRDCNR